MILFRKELRWQYIERVKYWHPFFAIIPRVDHDGNVLIGRIERRMDIEDNWAGTVEHRYYREPDHKKGRIL